MAKRVEPCRKSPGERLDDLLAGHREASLRGEGAKYARRALESSDSLPNGVKFYAWAFLAAEAPEEDEALAALAEAEGYLPAARAEFGRRLEKELPALEFLERGIGLLTERGDFEGALRLCDLALRLGLGAAYERKRASLSRMV